MKITPHLFIFSLLMLVAGCTQPAQVSFSVKNSSSTNVFIRYSLFENDDTIIRPLGNDTLITILETENASGSSNWFYDYKMHIHNIYNNLGDSINFDPNVSQYWFLYVGAPNYQYKLDVTDSSFQ